jgi:hypothetical protein
MGPRLRGNDEANIVSLRTVIPAQTRTHNPLPKSQYYGVSTTFLQSSSFLSNIL